MRTLPQQSHADIGLGPDADHTEDLRKKSALGRCANTAEGDRTQTQPLSEEKVLMTTIPTTTDPGLPPNAEPDLWVGGQRDVYAQIGHVATSGDLLKCPAVTVVGEQRVNGDLGKIDVVLDVALQRSSAELTPGQARELAALLVAGADLADTWSGTLAAGRRDCDLLADVPLPPGITAGEWEIDDAGRLYRELSDGRRQRGYGDIYDAAPALSDQLAAAKAALLAVHSAVKMLPGNCGDYVRAALDSLADAQAVLR